jgi:hypothetical protein
MLAVPLALGPAALREHLVQADGIPPVLQSQLAFCRKQGISRQHSPSVTAPGGSPRDEDPTLEVMRVERRPVPLQAFADPL